MRGPKQVEREKARTYVWIRALDQDDKKFEAGLETLESYSFTAVSVPQIAALLLEKVASERGHRNKGGVYTPAQAFGADFVTCIPSTVRFGMLEPPRDDASAKGMVIDSSNMSQAGAEHISA